MTFQGAKIDIDGKVFVFQRKCTITSGVRTGYLIGGSGSTVNSVFQGYVDDGNPFNDSASDAFRRGVFLDLGGGVRYVTIDIFGYEGNSVQWGDATGADPFTQMDELIDAIAATQIDSFRPATLEYGEFSDEGSKSPINVVFEEPNLEIDADEPNRFTGNITCLAAADLTEVTDGITRLG